MAANLLAPLAAAPLLALAGYAAIMLGASRASRASVSLLVVLSGAPMLAVA